MKFLKYSEINDNKNYQYIIIPISNNYFNFLHDYDRIKIYLIFIINVFRIYLKPIIYV